MSDHQPPYPGQTPYGQAPSSPEGRPGELLDRFLARLIDGILIAVVNLIILGVLGASVGAGNSLGVSFLVTAIATVLSTAVTFGYFVWLETGRGQTLGKMAMKLRVTGAESTGNPTVEQSVRRNCFYAANLFGVIPFLGSVLGGFIALGAAIAVAVTISSDTLGRRGWHDRFAGGTQVLKIG